MWGRGDMCESRGYAWVNVWYWGGHHHQYQCTPAKSGLVRRPLTLSRSGFRRPMELAGLPLRFAHLLARARSRCTPPALARSGAVLRSGPAARCQQNTPDARLLAGWVCCPEVGRLTESMDRGVGT